MDTPITAVQTDEQATGGGMAWLSERSARQDPARIERFSGSLLIAPIAASGSPAHGGLVIRSPRPKLAFSQAVDRFFQSLTAIEWPRPEHGGVHPNAVVGVGAQLAPGVVVGSNVRIGDRVAIGPGTCLANCDIGCDVRIGANCTIGLPGFGYERDASGRYWRFPHMGKVVIHEGVEIGSCTCVDRGAIGDTIIGAAAKIDNLVHIAHNVVLGPNVLVIANAMVAGSVTIDSDAWIAPSAAIMNKLRVGRGALVGLGAVVTRSVDAGVVVAGNPARPLRSSRDQ